MIRTSRVFVSCLVLALATSGARSAEFSAAVSALNPTFYYPLDETTFGAVTNLGSGSSSAVHEGDAAPVGVEPVVGDPFGKVGAPGPNVNIHGEALVGMGASNKSLFTNGSLAVNLGPGTNFGAGTMTYASWFKVPCVESEPGITECQGPPASTGGERLFTTNFNGTNTGGASDVDDLGHFQIDLGFGANLVISIDNNFSDPLHSNFQIPHRDNHPGPFGPAGPGSGLAIKDENWHHIVASRNGDLLTNMRLVIDGVEITQDRWADSTDSWGISAPFDARLGTRDTAPHDRTWNGWIDESAIWLNRQLTVLESQVMYHAALGYLKADFDGNSLINAADVNSLVAGIIAGTNPAAFDLTGDGSVNTADLTLWLALAGGKNLGAGRSYRVGDANLDGVVDGTDFGLWNSNKFTASQTWSGGNFNADSVTDGSDFGLWNANKFTASDSSLVPEPAGLLCVLLGVAGLSLRRK